MHDAPSNMGSGDDQCGLSTEKREIVYMLRATVKQLQSSNLTRWQDLIYPRSTGKEQILNCMSLIHFSQERVRIC